MAVALSLSFIFDSLVKATPSHMIKHGNDVSYHLKVQTLI